MNINGPDPAAREVLLEVARRMREIDNTPEPPAWRAWEVLEHRELKTYGPRYSPAVWFGGGRPIPERHRVRYLRALHELAAGGLLVRGTLGGRTTHVVLTPAGLAAAVALDPTLAPAPAAPSEKLVRAPRAKPQKRAQGDEAPQPAEPPSPPLEGNTAQGGAEHA